MNGSRDLYKRLLHLFSINTIKDYFQVTGNAKDIIESLTGDKTQQVLKNFAAKSMLLTRQNIYLYKLSKAFKQSDLGDDFPYNVEVEESLSGNFSFFLLPKTTFTVYLSNPTEKEDLIFFQPVMVRISGNVLMVHFTKLNKNEKYYFPEARFPKKSTINENESEVLEKILDFFRNKFTITELDMNAGVKRLWEKDQVDCVSIQWRLPHSINTATMDETMTFKEKYPKDYKDILTRPLGKTNFIYLQDDDVLCPKITIDPTEGYISITNLPKFPNQVTNVISEILAHN